MRDAAGRAARQRHHSATGLLFLTGQPIPLSRPDGARESPGDRPWKQLLLARDTTPAGALGGKTQGLKFGLPQLHAHSPLAGLGRPSGRPMLDVLPRDRPVIADPAHIEDRSEPPA